MRFIYRYLVPAQGYYGKENKIDIKGKAKVISAGLQDTDDSSQVVLWAEVAPIDNYYTTVSVYVFRTGDSVCLRGLRFINTVITPTGYVFHVYVKKED